MTAQFSAYVTVEFALRMKTGDRKCKFARLLQRAVNEGWISDKGFSHPTRRLDHIRRMNAVSPPELQEPEPALVRAYSDALAKAIPSLRNDLAHGSSFLWEKGASHVNICAELINQLFALPEKTT